MSDKSPRQSSSKKSDKSLKEKRAIKKSKKSGDADGRPFPGRQPDEGERDERDDHDADGERDEADDEQGSPGDGHDRLPQAFAVAGAGAGTSLTLWAVTGLRRDAA